MDKLKKLVDKKIVEINNDIKKIDNFIQDAPEGTLNYKVVKNRVYYYQQLNDNKKKNKRKISQKYIKKKEISLAKALAQKSYYLAIKPILKEQHNQLSMFLDNYMPEEMQNVYDDLSDIRKGIITPIAISKEERIRQWNQDE